LKHLFLILGIKWKHLWRPASGGLGGRLATRSIIALIVVPWAFLLAYLAHQLFHSDALSPEEVHGLLGMGFAVFYLYTVLSPFFGILSADFLDIEKARLFPIGAGTLYTTSLLTHLFPPTVLFLLPSIGVGLLFISPNSAALGGNLAVFLFYVVHLATLRVGIVLLFLNLFKGRRYQDFVRILFPIGGLFFFVGLQFLVHGQAHDFTGFLSGFSVPGWAAWTPPFWHAGLLLSEEIKPVLYLYQLMMAILATCLFAVVGIVLLGKALTSEMASGYRKAGSTGNWEDVRHISTGGFLGGPTWGVMAKEFRVVRREPHLKTLLIQQAFLFLLPFIILLAQTGFDLAEVLESGSRIILPTLLILLFIEFQLFSVAFGLEGQALFHLRTMPIPIWKVFLAKNLVLGGIAFVWNALIVLAFGFLFRSPHQVGIALVVSTALLPILLGWSNLSSVLLPSPILGSGRSPLSQAGRERRGCLYIIGQYLNIFAVLLLCSPIFLIVPWRSIQTGSSEVMIVLAGVSVLVYGITLYLALLATASSIFRRREPRLIEIFTSAGA